MADLFSRSFHCLLVPSCSNLPPKPSEKRFRISAPIALPKRCVRVTRHSHMLANSTSSSTSSSSPNSVPEDYDILSSTVRSDGSVVFRFGNASEVREKMAELEREKLAGEGVEEGGEARVRTSVSEEGVEKLSTIEVDCNLGSEIEPSSTVVVGVADHSVQLPANGKDGVMLDTDSETAEVNGSQEIDRNLMLDSVEEGQHGVLYEDVAAEGNGVPSASEEDSEAASHKEVGVADHNLQLPVNEKDSVVLDDDSETAVVNDSQEIDKKLMLDSAEEGRPGILNEDVAIEGNGPNGVPSVSEEDSEADSHKEVGVADHNVQLPVNGKDSVVLDDDPETAVINNPQEIDRDLTLDTVEDGHLGILHEDVAAEGNGVLSVSDEGSEADSHKEVVDSTVTPESDLFSDLNSVLSGEVKVAAEGNSVPTASEEDSGADSHKEVVVSTVTPESDIFSDPNSVVSGEVEEKEADEGHGVDRSINEVAGDVDADLRELVPVSASLKSEQVANDEEATDHIAGVDSATNNLNDGVDVDTDFRELMPASTSLESEQVADDEETTEHIVEVKDSIDASKMAKSETLHDLAPSSDLETKIDVGNTEISDYENPSVPSEPEISSVETASHGEKTSRTELFLISSAACLPHPSKALTGREDAYFISHENWLGIADGIGHWSLEGSNTGLYMKELMEKCENIVSNHENISTIKPAEVITRSAAETQSPGSSAILVAHFDGQAIHAANVGNTGFIIIRDGSIFKKSTPMFHEFNFPLQIVKGDDPSEIIEGYKINVNDGDVIITATNGLFDNLYDQEIASIISKSLQASLRPQEIAEFLAIRAQEVGKSAYERSPFADAAQAVGYVGYTGGKLDDITVIVSLVKQN